MQSRIDEVQELYDKITNKLYTDREAFGEYLRFSGKFYKTPAVDTMMIFESNPDADMVADFSTWQKFGHYVRRNERSIAVPTQDGKLKHYFDISQTNGKKIPYRWSLDKDTAQKYLQQLSSEQQREFKSLSSAVDYLSDQAVALRATEIRRKYDIPDEQAEAFDRSVCTMVRQVVAARCGYESSFKYKSTPIDYTAIDMLHGNRMPERMEFEHLAGDIQQTAKSVLLEMEKSINTIIQQRSIENEYERQNRERHQTDLVRGGQEVLPRNDRGERQEVSPGHRELDLSSGAVPGSDSRTGGDDGRTDRQIRESVAEIYGGEPPRSDTIVSGQNEMVYNSQGGGQGSGGALSDIGGELRESEQPSSNGVYGAVSLGENEDNDLRTPGDGGYSSSVQSISEENRATYSTNTETAEEYSPAVALFKDYATTQLTYYDIAVREAFLSGNKQEFKSLATKYLDNLMADVVLGTTEIEGCDRAEITKLYAEMYEDFQVRVDLYDEILKSTYAAHEKNNVARQFAKENNIPFDEYPYDPDEDFDPYAYNPNRMSDESYDRLHQLLEADKYLEEELLSGQGLVADGKFTIEEHYRSNNQTPEDFGKKLYEFYGDGGHNAQGDLWYIKRSEEGITFKYRPDLNKDDISFSWTAIAQRTAQLLDEGKYITQDDLEQRENRAELLRETEPTTESDQPDIDDTLHAAFEAVKAEYSFSDKANEFLDRAERQMSINGYQSLEPQMFKLAVFAQNYGTVSRIDEKLFDGKLKEVIGKINAQISQLDIDKTVVTPTYDDIGILTADIEALRTLEPRKSVLNFTAEEIELTEKWRSRFSSDVGTKSPFYRAINGEWRNADSNTVPILEIEDVSATFSSVRADIKDRTIIRGTVVNDDSQWQIQVSRTGLEDTIHYANKNKDEATMNAMYHIDDILKNAVLLDTTVSEPNNGNKSVNTAFMHKMYGVCRFRGEPYLAKMSVEEIGDGKQDTMRRLYNMREIKIEPLRRVGFIENQLAQSVLNGSTISISDLFSVVKGADTDFYINKRTDSREHTTDSATHSTNQITITCDFSESAVFEAGKEYSAAKFDRMMAEADKERYDGWKAGLAKYGSDEAWETEDKEGYYKYIGYDKTQFTINMPDGSKITERQDIGDGIGGVIDFLEQIPQYNTVVEQLKAQVYSETTKTETVTAQNFHITDDALGEGGLKTKFTANIEAIKTLKLIETENRTATPAEQEILSKYVGWGGMPQAFDSSNQQWTAEYRQLKELLTPEEYEAAAGSTLNAHYTSPEIIRAMYKAVSNMGFKGGNILEPAMGVGNFFGCMPDIMQNSKLYGVELDSITGRIAQQLYPDANIQVKGYEKTDYPDNFFDLAIGNVPFGNYGVADKRYDSNHFLIHDYFFAKTLDKVAPGGVVAFVTSKGTLDKANPKVREYLAKRADLVGAIRLPNTAFKANANTEVTSDIIFLQKREKMAVETPDWCYTAPNADGISINQYFIDNPDMVLGKMEYTTGQFGQEATCTHIEGANLAEQLDIAVTKLKAKIIIQDRADKKAEAQGIIPVTDDVRNFTHALIDGKLYFRENNIMTEVEEKGKTLQRKIGMHELRNTMRELIDAQTRNCSDEELQQLQQRLNTQYDKFYTQFGSINSSPNSSAFREDDDYNTLCSLEIINPETKEVTKAAIFTQRTIKPVLEITSVETAQEAMQVALDVKGRIDIPYMAQLCSQSPESVCNELLNSGQIFLNPEAYSEDNPYEGYEEASEYLSGNVREKLKAAEQAAQIDPTTYSRNAEALKEVLPPTIGAGEITARIGVSWVDTKDYELFLREYAKATFHAPIRRTPMGEYKIEHKTWDNSVAATSTYGTSRMSSYHIFEQLLNNRDVAVRDKVKSDDGKERYVINRKETQLAAEKARQMKEAFAKWLWADPARRQKYVERYNVLFNSIVGRHYDGSHQTFPGMSPHIQLNPHQKDAVARAKYGGNTLLAHCVGAGKSFEMVAATMEKKRLGLINKACVVVPKHLVGQTANEWLRLYPDANILVATEKDFEKNNRQKFIARCCTGDYAAVIMSYEQFEKIPMSLQYREQFLRRELNMLTQSISQLDPYRDRTSIKDLERAKKRVEARISKLLEGGKTKDTSLSFEQLGFDSLVVDEAHHYKNGLVISKMNNVSGVQTTPAEKSEDILMKTQYLNETTGHKNILFATGTPVTNSMTELYTMQRYLRPDLLEDAGLQNFDDWASTFGEVVSQLELKPAGDGFRTKKRFAKFANLPELMQMYKEFADIRTAEMLKLPVPEIQGGKAQTVVAKPNEFQQAYMQILAERSEAIHNGTVDPTVDNMLKITHEARLLGLDARCLNSEAENYPDSKVNMCIDNIIKIYNDTTEQKGVQAVFCDIAVNDDNGRFSVYDYIRDELVRRGIPADEICAAGDAHNQKQRSEMYAQLRSGTKRIVLASTTKMGTGANIQTRLAALHHLDIPWKPSEVEPIQRNFL